MSTPDSPALMVFSGPRGWFGEHKYVLKASTVELWEPAFRRKPLIYELRDLSGQYTCHQSSSFPWAVIPFLFIFIPVFALGGWVIWNDWETHGRVGSTSAWMSGLLALLLGLICSITWCSWRDAIFMCVFSGRRRLTLTAATSEAEALHRFAIAVARQITMVRSGRLAGKGDTGRSCFVEMSCVLSSWPPYNGADMDCIALTHLKVDEEMISNPEERANFYLSQAEITASHLADLMEFFALESRHAEIGKRDVFQCVDYCISRLVTMLDQMECGEQFGDICRLLHENLVHLRGWSGPASTAVRYASIVLSAVVVLERLRGLCPPSEPAASEANLRQEYLPLSVAHSSPLVEQAQHARENLVWLAREMRKKDAGQPPR